MKKHLLFFDIDGTLIDEKTGIVPQSTLNALHEAGERGHLLFLCTGRTKAIWPKDILAIGFDGVVGGCGTHIYYKDREIFHSVLDAGLQRELADDLVRFRIDGVLEGSRYTYFRDDMWIPEVIRIHKGNADISDACLKSWNDELEFDKMALWFDETSDMDAFRAKYENRFDFIMRDPAFYEVVPKGCTKATGIEFLCRYLGMSREATIGFGDSTNDLSMLSYTGISIAMGSGNPDIFSAVDYVTAPVMEDGIEKALKKYNVIGGK